MDEEKLRQFFDQNDKTGTGYISKKVIRKVIKQSGGSDDVVDDVLSQLDDGKHSSKVSWEEFCEAVFG